MYTYEDLHHNMNVNNCKFAICYSNFHETFLEIINIVNIFWKVLLIFYLEVSGNWPLLFIVCSLWLN